MYSFNGELWLYDGDAAWYFITLPAGISKEIKMVAPARRGFGSLRVAAKIGTATGKHLFSRIPKAAPIFCLSKKKYAPKTTWRLAIAPKSF